MGRRGALGVLEDQGLEVDPFLEAVAGLQVENLGFFLATMAIQSREWSRINWRVIMILEEASAWISPAINYLMLRYNTLTLYHCNIVTQHCSIVTNLFDVTDIIEDNAEIWVATPREIKMAQLQPPKWTNTYNPFTAAYQTKLEKIPSNFSRRIICLRRGWYGRKKLRRNCCSVHEVPRVMIS